MRLGRLVLVVATLVTILVFPVLIRDALQALRLPSAYAAAGPMDAAGRVYQNGNVNDNGGGNNDDDDDDDNDNNDDDESDNEGEDNDNEGDVCYESLNSNEEVPCDYDDNGNYDDNVYYDNGNANDNVYTPPPAPAPIGYDVAASRRCFGAQESGDVQLTVEGGTVVVRVVSTGTFPQSTWIELDDVADLSTVPAPPGGAYFLGKLVWYMNSGNGCDGPGMGMLPGAVNLGIPYNAPADKSKLQIVMLKNNAWVEVPTVPDPDPNKPYISSTVQETGIYAVIHKP